MRGEGKAYDEDDLSERLTHELSDIEEWLKPTEIEERLRLLTIFRYKRLIEHYYPNLKVCVQGSSATNTYLPTSDIDLILLNFPKDGDTVGLLKNITKILWKYKMIVQGFILANAKVPLSKVVDRPYGFHIDICVNNINGALNVPRVKKYMEVYPILRPVLMFLKLICYASDTDDPATGGFGSNQLINFCLFGVQSNPEIKNSGELLLYIMNFLAYKLNFYLCGISTINGGCLFSKQKTGLLDAQCPQAFIFEDPQMPNIFFGNRTHRTMELVALFRKGLENMETVSKESASPIGSFIPPIDDLIERRKSLEYMGSLLERPSFHFARIINDKTIRDWDEKPQSKAKPILAEAARPNHQNEKKPHMPRSKSSPDIFEYKPQPKKHNWQFKMQSMNKMKDRKNRDNQQRGSRAIPKSNSYRKFMN